MAGIARGIRDHQDLCGQQCLELVIGQHLVDDVVGWRRLGLELTQLITKRHVGARLGAGADAYGGSGELRSRGERSISAWAFAGVAVCSFGGPLALAGLNAPGLVVDAGSSAGLATLAGVVVFLAPLIIWLRYARHVSDAGGLYTFVREAAGPRIALGQAAVWIVSYALYLVYTTVQIVYDLLPTFLPGERRYQTLLALLIPVAIVAVMVAGRAAALAVLGALALGQLALAGVLVGETLGHLSTPAASFGASAPAGSLAKASAQTSLLYVCGSLPLFLGGEVARPRVVIRRGLIAAYAVTALVVVAAVAPLAAAPGLLRTDVPGVRVLEQYSGTGLAQAVGVGIAASIGGVILCEYLALGRLLHAIGGWRLRPVNLAIGLIVIAAAPISLINPDGFYTALIKPSLIALWVSQLIVFLVYPRFALRHGQRLLPAAALSLIATGLVGYGLWTAIQLTTS